MSDLFFAIRRDGEAALKALVDARMQETVTLDFKMKQDPSSGRFSKEDKTILGRALSGFANSAGGILIWGVDARKGEDGIDCAQGLSPINDLERFTSEAQTLVGQLLIPRHDGIQLEAIPSEAQKGSGYLLIMIDRSERRPHRCEAAGDKQYYKRAGDNTFAMEHYDIEDAFRRAGVPSIQFEITMSVGKRFNLELTQEILQVLPIYHHVFIKNTGTAVAKHLYMALDRLSNFNVFGLLNSQPSPLSQISRDGDHTYYVGPTELVLHPGLRVEVLRLVLHYKKNWQGRTTIGDGVIGHIGGAQCVLRGGAENAREAACTLDTDSQQIAIYLGEQGISF